MTTIIASTNRPDSYTLKIAQYYQRQLLNLGHSAEILSLTDLPEGIIHPAMYEKQKLGSFEILQKKVTGTDKFLFIIPEYNGSFPGILKVFVDALRYPESFYGKKAALVGVSNGRYGNIRGIDHFTGVCHYLNMDVLPLKLHIPYIQKELDENGNFFKEDTLKFTSMQIERFAAF
ncbi:NADPH-dependent FMN reductase [Pararcticibacter amylolyticus]|uniref:NADPH-dependent FMN reductase n=1 Tax=Pararcticibacter amylolyticus TaxID=2173175 RepID=A0A2U2PE46_9SPHI|nr:NADPH-dependent FMN reductase [Pararcticibacter amylolyticus]PWG79630.1 NADPH-dependent FMN reductase [Pararcticibacter amylolyticus]